MRPMELDSAKNRAGDTNLSPMGIANHPLFTAREKIDLLNELKAEVTRGDGERNLGFSAEEIDRAIAEVRRKVQNGVGADTVLGGDA